MNTRIVMLGQDSFRAEDISMDLIAKVMPAALLRCGRSLRKADGSQNTVPSSITLDILFREYLKYLREYQFRYKLSTGNIFWSPASVGSPAGNCQTVASNFLYLLWAFGFAAEALGIQIVEVSHPKDEKIVTKNRTAVNEANVCFTEAHLLGENRGTRSFKVNPLTSGIEPLFPARNPFLFHAISYVATGGYYKYYDARTGCKYINGATDLFEGFQKGADFQYAKGAAASGFISLSSLSQATTLAFADPNRPARRMYLLPQAYDAHPAVATSIGDYSEGGNWIFVDEADWGGRTPPKGTQPPAHVKKMFETAR